MTPAERDAGLEWMRYRFAFLKFAEPSLVGVLNEAQKITGSTYKLGVVIDPWNTLEHHRPRDLQLTEYVSQQLSQIISFTREEKAHVWLVAHPKKPERDKAGRPPGPYDISDSAHFYNKADSIIVVHRDQMAESQEVQIHVQKCRFKHIGHIGMVPLTYDKTTGRYYDRVVDHAIANYYKPHVV